MIKKILGIGLLFLALFGIIACGNAATTSTEEPTTEEPTTEQPTTTQEPTTEIPTTTETPTTTEEPVTEEPFATELFISEYGEGSSFNKYLEIFNGTGETVDLSDYSIQLYSNGAASPSQSLNLSGSLDNFDVLVIAHPNADALILEQADSTDAQVINFNGNDPITLSKNSIVIDSISGPGDDSEFGKDVNLVRKSTITGPNNSFDISEWDSYPQDTFTYIGSHADFSPSDTALLEQDLAQLPDSIDIYGDYAFGSGSNGSTYTILNVTGTASSYVTYSEDYIISSVDEDVTYEGQIEVEVSLEGVGTTTKIIDLYLKFTTLDLRTHPEYYNSLEEGLSGQSLLLALRSILNDGFSGVTYGEARYILDESDADPNNPDNIILVYSQSSISGVWDYGVTWNREHVWPQSFLEEGSDNNTVNSASDLQNLKPANPSENSSRGNKYFDNIVSNDTYEPHDDVKGDLARILFYMVVMYDELELVDDGGLINTGSLNMGLLNILLSWHIQDPVDDFELNRNNVIYSYQQNRNPFIDNPDFVELIWGEISNN